MRTKPKIFGSPARFATSPGDIVLVLLIYTVFPVIATGVAIELFFS